jgi:hypothetical protein
VCFGIISQISKSHIISVLVSFLKKLEIIKFLKREEAGKVLAWYAQGSGFNP